MRTFAELAFLAILLPATALAQVITGAVRDATGGLLPGVTVEASSPVLIEKTRTVVTDGTGQYRIIDLCAGRNRMVAIPMIAQGYTGRAT